MARPPKVQLSRRGAVEVTGGVDLRWHQVAGLAGYRPAQGAGDQVPLVRAHAGAAGRGGAGEIAGRRRAGGRAVAGGAALAELHLPVQVAPAGDVDAAISADGLRVTGAAVAVGRVRRRRGEAVAGLAGGLGAVDLRPHRLARGAAAQGGAMTIRVGAGAAGEGGGDAAGAGQRAERQLRRRRAVQVPHGVDGSGHAVTLGAGHRGADGGVADVRAVGTHAAEGGLGVAGQILPRRSLPSRAVAPIAGGLDLQHAVEVAAAGEIERAVSLHGLRVAGLAARGGRVRRRRRQAVTGATRGLAAVDARPGGHGERRAGERGPVAVHARAGRGGAIVRRGAALRGQRAERHLRALSAVEVAGRVEGRRHAVALLAGDGPPQHGGRQVRLVRPHARRRGGGVALQILRRRGAGGRAVAPGAALPHVDPAIEVVPAGDVDGLTAQRRQRVTGGAAGVGRVRRWRREAVAARAADLGAVDLRPLGLARRAAGQRGAVAVDVGAGGRARVPDRRDALGLGQRPERQLRRARRVEVARAVDLRGHPVALRAVDGPPRARVAQVRLVRSHAPGRGGHLAGERTGRRGIARPAVTATAPPGGLHRAVKVVAAGDVDGAVGLDGVGVAERALGQLWVRRRRRVAVARAARALGAVDLRPHGGALDAAGEGGAVAVDVGAGGAIALPLRRGALGHRQRAEGDAGRRWVHVARLLGVAGPRVTLFTPDGAADGGGPHVLLVGPHAQGGGGGVLPDGAGRRGVVGAAVAAAAGDVVREPVAQLRGRAGLRHRGRGEDQAPPTGEMSEGPHVRTPRAWPRGPRRCGAWRAAASPRRPG